MGFKIPENTLSITLKLFATITQKMEEADAAFGGASGSGAKKKEFVKSAIREGVALQDMIKADLLSPAEEAKLLEAADHGVEFIFSSVELVQMFQARVPKV